MVYFSKLSPSFSLALLASSALLLSACGGNSQFKTVGGAFNLSTAGATATSGAASAPTLSVGTMVPTEIDATDFQFTFPMTSSSQTLTLVVPVSAVDSALPSGTSSQAFSGVTVAANAACTSATCSDLVILFSEQISAGTTIQDSAIYTIQGPNGAACSSSVTCTSTLKYVQYNTTYASPAAAQSALVAGCNAASAGSCS